MIKTLAPKKLKGRVLQTLSATGQSFSSQPSDGLDVSYTGVVGDFHNGITRLSGAREPWYTRGTEMRNERQISILSIEELNEISNAMGLEVLEPGWIGANLVLEGIANMSYLPPRSLLFFDGGVTLRIDGYNAPCLFAGKGIADNVNTVGDNDVAQNFVKAARMKRGLVAWVEREGRIEPGEDLTVRVWEQWLYE